MPQHDENSLPIEFMSYAVETRLPCFQIRRIDMIIEKIQSAEHNPEGMT